MLVCSSGLAHVVGSRKTCYVDMEDKYDVCSVSQQVPTSLQHLIMLGTRYETEVTLFLTLKLYPSKLAGNYSLRNFTLL